MGATRRLAARHVTTGVVTSPHGLVSRYARLVIPCPACERFVLDSSRECRFCGAALHDGPSPLGGFAGILLGLALAACGTTEPSSEDGGSTTVNASTTSTTDDPSATSTSSSSGQITSLDEDSAEVAAYAGPGSFTDTFPDTTGDTDSTGTGTGTSSTGTSSGTDTGTGSGTESGTSSTSG